MTCPKEGYLLWLTTNCEAVLMSISNIGLWLTEDADGKTECHRKRVEDATFDMEYVVEF